METCIIYESKVYCGKEIRIIDNTEGLAFIALIIMLGAGIYVIYQVWTD